MDFGADVVALEASIATEVGMPEPEHEDGLMSTQTQSGYVPDSFDRVSAGKA